MPTALALAQEKVERDNSRKHRHYRIHEHDTFYQIFFEPIAYWETAPARAFDQTLLKLDEPEPLTTCSYFVAKSDGYVERLGALIAVSPRVRESMTRNPSFSVTQVKWVQNY